MYSGLCGFFALLIARKGRLKPVTRSFFHAKFGQNSATLLRSLAVISNRAKCFFFHQFFWPRLPFPTFIKLKGLLLLPPPPATEPKERGKEKVIFKIKKIAKSFWSGENGRKSEKMVFFSFLFFSPFWLLVR